MPKNGMEMQLLLEKLALEESLKFELLQKEQEILRLLAKIDNEETLAMDLPALQSKHGKLTDEVRTIKEKITQFKISSEDRGLANQFKTTIGLKDRSFMSVLAVILKCAENLKSSLFALWPTPDKPTKALSSLPEPDRQDLNTAKDKAACEIRGKLQEAAKSALGQFTFETSKSYALGKDMSSDLAAVLSQFTQNLQKLQKEDQERLEHSSNDGGETPQPGI